MFPVGGVTAFFSNISRQARHHSAVRSSCSFGFYAESDRGANLDGSASRFLQERIRGFGLSEFAADRLRSMQQRRSLQFEGCLLSAGNPANLSCALLWPYRSL